MTPHAGNALFAVWAFRKNDLITEYSGPQLTRAQALKEPIQTHIAKQATDAYVSGLRQPVTGSGGGSFANHKSPGQNAELQEVGNTLYLKAKATIMHGAEITLSYGKPGQLAYDVAMGTKRFK